MSLHQTDIQTRRWETKYIFPYFSLFYLTDLILPDRADKNMNWYVIPNPLRKCAYIRSIRKTGDKKNFDFSIFFFIFSPSKRKLCNGEKNFWKKTCLKTCSKTFGTKIRRFWAKKFSCLYVCVCACVCVPAVVRRVVRRDGVKLHPPLCKGAKWHPAGPPQVWQGH